MTPKECWEDLVVGANAAFRIVFSPKGELARTIKGILWAQKQMEEKDAEIARLKDELKRPIHIEETFTNPTPKTIVGKLHGG